ncbi:MAG: hypothetical protein ACFHWX_15705 [Bacteroidota bacterium]
MEPKKNGLISYSAIAISVIALGFSFYTFYHTEVRVKHDIQLSCVKKDFRIYHPSRKMDSLLIPIVFKNSGNQSEIILDCQTSLFQISKDQLKKLKSEDSLMIIIEAHSMLDSLLSHFTLDNKGSIQPGHSNKFIIDEGEIKEINASITFPLFDISENNASTSSDIFLVGLNVSYLNKLGKQSKETFTLGVIGVDKGFLLFESFKGGVFDLF